jgi:hypothetical protein
MTAQGALLAILLSLPLVACAGSGTLGGGDTKVDDDDDGPHGGGQGNIDWDQKTAPLGTSDCREGFQVSGEETTEEDGALCPECDVIWTVTLEADSSLNDPPDLDCLAESTGLVFPDVFQRRVGMTFSEVYFTYYQHLDPDDEPLGAAGVGAFLGTEFTWSGRRDHSVEDSDGFFTSYHAGSGAF